MNQIAGDASATSVEDDLTAESIVPLPEPVQTLAPTPKLTDEELEKGWEEAKNLMTKGHAKYSAPVNFTAQVLCLARQLYSMARVMTQKRVQEAGGSPAAEEAIVRAMAGLAEKPFDSEELHRRLAQHVLPIIEMENERQKQAQKNEDLVQDVSDETRRRQQRIPLGFTYAPGVDTVGHGQKDVREKPLIFVGPRGALSYILDEIADHTVQMHEHPDLPHHNVIYLTELLVPDTLNRQHDQNYVAVGSHQWAGSAETANGFRKAMSVYIKRLLGHTVDLLLVADLRRLISPAAYRELHELQAAASLRILSSWMKEYGSGVIAGLAISPSYRKEDLPETITDHAVICPVVVHDGFGEQEKTHYRVQVGPDEGAHHVFIVEKSLIESEA